ncbi:MAG TPA: alginate lyase family protein, partial [Thermoanaerobaculia bacterium]
LALASVAGTRAGSDASWALFVERARGCFFEGPFDANLVDALSSEHRRSVLATAEEICAGRFRMLGYRGLEIGTDPDWHRDAVSGRVAPRIHSSLIDPLDAAVIGDSTVTGELNRHQGMVRLAQAYRISGDERFAAEIVRHTESWLDHNRPGVGINWTSSLELALRLIAWTWALVLIRESSAVTAEFFQRLLASIGQHARRIERNLSFYFSPNTHLTGEALGLVYAGTFYAELPGAERWRTLGTRILVSEISEHVLRDGVYFERSTCYQRYTIDIYTHFLLLADRRGVELPHAVRESVRSMVDFVAAVQQPDRSMPQIGDADGGTLLPLADRDAVDYTDMFSTAAVIFDDAAFAHVTGGLAPETLWLLGTRALSYPAASAPATDASRLFPEGGYAIQRSDWTPRAHSLLFDAGPLGCNVSAGHGHADLLSIQCSVFGEPYLVDAGTGNYTGDSTSREYFRGTFAHSTVAVDGRSQAESAGPFAWRSRCDAKLRGWSANDALVIADGEHDGYATLADPVTHRRRVLFIDSRFWVIVDDLTGNAMHDVEVRFQFAPMTVQLDADQLWVRATRDGAQGLLLRVFDSVGGRSAVRCGIRAPMEGWISPDYGQVVPAPVVVHNVQTRVPARFVSVLWPAEDIGAAAPSPATLRDVVRERAGIDLVELT